MSNEKQGSLSIHPYIGGSTTNLVKNVWKNGGVDKAHVSTLLLTLLGTLLTWPLRVLEKLLYGRKIANTQITQDPIFIIGHWRSGTTHLHNVIGQDKNLGYLTTLQALFPSCAVLLSRSKFLKKLVAEALPEKRMMDNVRMDLSYPQEEEFSMSCLTTVSHHCNHFPKTIHESFDKYVLLNMSDKEKRKWKKAYLGVVKKATFLAGGKRLVLKNPYNTARIPILLELFPNAKFIHIYRNPYNIYVSAVHDFVKEAEEMALQKFSEEEFAETCFILYEKLMTAYWERRALVPKGNIAEIAFEKLEDQPIEELDRVYRELGLIDRKQALKNFAAYLDSISGYKKNKYSYSAALMEKIGHRWDFALKKMNYALPEDIVVSNHKEWTCKMDY